MKYSLFLDDERFPPRDNRVWIVSRNVREAKAVIEALGWPVHISFDHDLGEGELTGKDFANWIIEQDIDFNVLSNDFTFYVHSQNPVGAENIRSLMEQYTLRRI